MKWVYAILTSLGCVQKILGSFKLKLESRQIRLSIQPRNKCMWGNLMYGFQWLSFANAFTQCYHAKLLPLHLPHYCKLNDAVLILLSDIATTSFWSLVGLWGLWKFAGAGCTQSLEQWAGLKVDVNQWSSLKEPLPLVPQGFEQHLGGWQSGER